MKILVVEDEDKIAGFVKSGLAQQGHDVDTCGDGDEGLRMASAGGYDVIVLDIMLPGRDGIAVLRQLRDEGKNTPVILLTARDGVEDRVQGLNVGADDYLTKPFFVEELSARINAVTRRHAGENSTQLSAGGLTLNCIKREATVGPVKVILTSREFSLLEYLMRVPGNVYTRTQILEKVWEYHFDPRTNIIDVYIQRLRSKLADAGLPDFIETVRGVGYRVRT